MKSSPLSLKDLLLMPYCKYHLINTNEMLDHSLVWIGRFTKKNKNYLGVFVNQIRELIYKSFVHNVTTASFFGMLEVCYKILQP